MPSKLWDVLDYLPGLFEGALTSNAIVLDGPQPRKTTPPERYVIVGSLGGDTGLDEDRDDTFVDQSWATISGTGIRNESGQIPCSAWSWSGSTDTSLLRAQCKQDVADIETALIADRSLGGMLTSAPGGFGVELTRLSIWQSQFMTGDGSMGNALGTFVRASFFITWTTRLNPA